MSIDHDPERRKQPRMVTVTLTEDQHAELIELLAFKQNFEAAVRMLARVGAVIRWCVMVGGPTAAAVIWWRNRHGG